MKSNVRSLKKTLRRLTSVSHVKMISIVRHHTCLRRFRCIPKEAQSAHPNKGASAVWEMAAATERREVLCKGTRAFLDLSDIRERNTGVEKDGLHTSGPRLRRHTCWEATLKGVRILRWTIVHGYVYQMIIKAGHFLRKSSTSSQWNTTCLSCSLNSTLAIHRNDIIHKQ